jgi:anthranilate phosphoribosyltransferase
MKAIGYSRAMVVHGYDNHREKGMDELSTIGESVVCEFHPDGREEHFVLAPEDVGIRRADYDDIAAVGDTRREARRFLQVLAGTGSTACIDLTCLNAGAILYLIGAAAGIRAGVDLSRDIIHSGSAIKKLAAWVSTQADTAGAGIARFSALARATGIDAAAG